MKHEPQPEVCEPVRPGLELVADCSRCLGLCCVALPFSASRDFAIDKPAGQPCRNLLDDFRCSIHDRLRGAGFPGCTVYDCFGAGQQVSQVTFGGRDWRDDDETARSMFEVFTVMRQLHELLWYLREALAIEAARPIHNELRAACDETERLTGGSAADLAALDVAAHREAANLLLLQASELARAGHPAGKNFRGADLMGADFRGVDLRGASLRGALLIAADLSGADLRSADLIGADLRDANLRAADLTDSIFVTQSQLNAAKGDLQTRLPVALRRPGRWVDDRAG